MDLSIIIVSYNTKELLSKCLSSILSATKNIKSEIFVVDNNSWDGTQAFIKQKFTQIQLIENKKNIGFSKANNQGIQKAAGKYILILNPDTQVTKDTFKIMLNFMEKRKDIALATCKVEYPNGQLDKDCRRHFPTPIRAIWHFSGISKIFPKSKTFGQYYYGYIPDNIEHEIDACAGSFMLIRKHILDKVKGFDEDFFFYGEDLDLCYRIKNAGYKVIYTPITKIIHYKGASSGIKKSSEDITKATKSSKNKALKESTRAMKLFYEKHYKQQYPFYINWLMANVINILQFVRLTKNSI